MDWEEKGTHIYIGSLIKSYIQSHLTPRWIPLNQTKTLTKLVVLEPFKNKTYNDEKQPLFQQLLHFKKPYQEVPLQSPLHKKE